MKRSITYTTTDGKSFPQRSIALKHEIAVVRRQRVSDCLHKLLKSPDAKANVSLNRVIDVLCEHAPEFTDALSARAAARNARSKSSTTAVT